MQALLSVFKMSDLLRELSSMAGMGLAFNPNPTASGFQPAARRQ
jgi:hypothetical protein